MFDRECVGYLKRAANANTVELAREQLQIAVRYLDGVGMTRGYTSIIYQTPNEDIGFWHRNLQASLDELGAVRETATQLERSNLLLKLRETLVDEGKHTATVPPGISQFPHNAVFACWAWAMLIIMLLVATRWIVSDG